MPCDCTSLSNCLHIDGTKSYIRINVKSVCEHHSCIVWMRVHVFDSHLMGIYKTSCKLWVLLFEIVRHSINTTKSPCIRSSVRVNISCAPADSENMSKSFELSDGSIRVAACESINLSGFQCEHSILRSHVYDVVTGSISWDSKLFGPC